MTNRHDKFVKVMQGAGYALNWSKGVCNGSTYTFAMFLLASDLPYFCKRVKKIIKLENQLLFDEIKTAKKNRINKFIAKQELPPETVFESFPALFETIDVLQGFTQQWSFLLNVRGAINQEPKLFMPFVLPLTYKDKQIRIENIDKFVGIYTDNSLKDLLQMLYQTNYDANFVIIFKIPEHTFAIGRVCGDPKWVFFDMNQLDDKTITRSVSSHELFFQMIKTFEIIGQDINKPIMLTADIYTVEKACHLLFTLSPEIIEKMTNPFYLYHEGDLTYYTDKSKPPTLIAKGDHAKKVIKALETEEIPAVFQKAKKINLSIKQLEIIYELTQHSPSTNNLELKEAIQAWKRDALSQKTIKKIEQQSDNLTLLLLCMCISCNFEAVKKAHSLGANFDIIDSENNTLVHLAAEYGYLDIFKYVYEHTTCRNIPNNQGETPFGVALLAGHFEIVKFLIEEKAHVNFDEPLKPHNLTALQIAAQKGYLDLVELFLEKSTKHQSVTQALHIAAKEGHLNVIQAIVRFNKTILEDNTEAIYQAAKNGKHDVVKYLLQVGVISDLYRQNPQNPNEHETPLYAAVKNGHYEIVATLLMNFASPNFRNNVDDLTPLHLALLNNDDRMMELLLKFDANPNIKATVYKRALLNITPLKDQQKIKDIYGEKITLNLTPNEIMNLLNKINPVFKSSIQPKRNPNK